MEILNDAHIIEQLKLGNKEAFEAVFKKYYKLLNVSAFYILRDEMDEIYELLKNAEFEGARSLNNSLYWCFRNNLITPEEAMAASENPTELQQMLRGAFHGTASY